MDPEGLALAFKSPRLGDFDVRPGARACYFRGLSLRGCRNARSDRGSPYGPERIRVTSVDQQDHMAESRKGDRAGPIHVQVRLAYYYSGRSGDLATVSKRGVHAL